TLKRFLGYSGTGTDFRNYTSENVGVNRWITGTISECRHPPYCGCQGLALIWTPRGGCARWPMTCSAKRQTRRETFLLGICIVETGIAAIWTATKPSYISRLGEISVT